MSWFRKQLPAISKRLPIGQAHQGVGKDLAQTHSSRKQVLRLTLFWPSPKPCTGLPLHAWVSFVDSVHTQTGLSPKDVSLMGKEREREKKRKEREDRNEWGRWGDFKFDFVERALQEHGLGEFSCKMLVELLSP